MRRRATAFAVAAGLTLAACGSADEAPAAEPATESAGANAGESSNDDSTEASSVTDEFASADETESSSDGATVEVATGVDDGTPFGEKPSVQIPSESPTELVLTDLIVGSGHVSELGDTVVTDYVGVLTADGTEFDNSYDRGQPITVTLGAGGVIAGFEQGLTGVQAGTRRQIDIPAELAYGSAGAGGVIPPNAAITFVVDVVEVQQPPPPPTLAPFDESAECPAADGSSEPRQEFSEYPPTCIDVTKTYTADIVTNLGSVTIALDAAAAPVTVNNFVTLARWHYFDGVSCHRIIPGFMAQCGDPTGTGSGGPGYRFADELPIDGSGYVAGAVAMANAGPNTNGSQFFIVTGDATFLPPSYSLFGTVIDGLDTTVPALDAVGNSDSNGVPPLEPVTIESVTITES